MEKRLIKTAKDLKEAKDFFGQVSSWDEEINEAVEDKQMPYLLIGAFSEDIEFGSMYQFDAVDINDLKALDD